jgi:hypothetical protein
VYVNVDRFEQNLRQAGAGTHENAVQSMLFRLGLRPLSEAVYIGTEAAVKSLKPDEIRHVRPAH